jgi:hypothetical protein
MRRLSLSLLVLILYLTFSVIISHRIPPAWSNPLLETQPQLSKPNCPEDLCDPKSKNIRKHAWKLWSQITQSSDPYNFWDNWKKAKETGKSINVPGKNKRDLKFSMEEISSLYAANPNPKKATTVLRNHSGGFETLYNPDALQYLDKHKIFDEPLPNEIPYLDSELKRVLNLSLTKHDLAAFPHESKIAKAIWRSVPITSEGAYFLIDWAPTECKDCPKGIRVIQNQEDCTLSTSEAVPTYVPISCFYHVKADDVGTQFVLVGLHVITKELPDWTWTTFWWYPKPNLPDYGDDRPNTISKPWNNYLMNSTISMEDPEEHEATFYESTEIQDPCNQTPKRLSKAKICFNPFLEGGFPNGKLSNCMNCHKRATYPLDHPEMMGFAYRGQIDSNNPCFAGKVRLDYLWSLRQAPVQPKTKFDEFVNTVNDKLNHPK